MRGRSLRDRVTPGTACRYVLGVDPGRTGAAVLLGDDMRVREVFLMPYCPDGRPAKKTRKGNVGQPGMTLDAPAFHKIMLYVKRTYPGVLAAVEDVGTARPGNSSASVAAFASAVGALKAAIAIADVPIVSVKPKAWQKSLLGRSTSDKGETYERLCEVLHDFPSHAILPRRRMPHDGVSDAAAIALYAMTGHNEHADA